MKNRAKCKLCQSIIESFYETDYVECKCCNISVSGGLRMECAAIDWTNFIRVDDQGNEIIPKVIEKAKEDVKQLYNEEKPSKEKLLEMLDEMIKSYENLPDNAKYSPVNHYDMLSVLLLVSSILRS